MSKPKFKSTLPETLSTDERVQPVQPNPNAKPVAQIMILWKAVDNGDGTKTLLEPEIQEVGVEGILPEAAWALGSLSVRYMEIMRVLQNAMMKEREEAAMSARVQAAGGVVSATSADLRHMELMTDIAQAVN